MTTRNVTQNASTGDILNAVATVLIVALIFAGYVGAISDLPVIV